MKERKPKPSWVQTTTSWETKKAIWSRWALGETDADINVYLELNQDKYEALSRDTVRKIRKELLAMPIDVVQKLIGELPDIRSFVEEQIPGLKERHVGFASEQINSGPDILVSKAKENHQKTLLDFIGRWEEGIVNIPTYAAQFLQEVYKEKKEGKPFRICYPLSGTSIELMFDFPVPAICSPIVMVENSDEADAAFLEDALRSHLCASEYDELWRSWDNLLALLSEVLLELIKENKDWASEDLDFEKAVRRDYIPFQCSYFRRYLIQIRLKGILPGRCYLCSNEEDTKSKKGETNNATEIHETVS